MRLFIQAKTTFKCRRYVQNDIFAMKLKHFVSKIKDMTDFLLVKSDGSKVIQRAMTKMNLENVKYKEWMNWVHLIPYCKVRGIKTKNSINNIPTSSMKILTFLFLLRRCFNLIMIEGSFLFDKLSFGSELSLLLKLCSSTKY